MKQIIKKFNNLIKRTLFKDENKTNNNFNISDFNKYLITFISLLFLYLFYLLIPLLYNKTWIQNNIEIKLLNEFKVNLSTSADISYRILPAPHFLIKDSKILVTVDQKEKSIAEIKEIQVFLSQKNFFKKEKLNIKKLGINYANFSLSMNDFKFLNEIKKKDLSNKKIIIKNSNIFLKDNLGKVISIIKINKIISFFDNKELSNFIKLKGNIFNVPFNFDFQYQNDSNSYEKIDIFSKPLKLNFSNTSIKKEKFTYGKNNILFLNSEINTKYSVKENLIIFKSEDSRLDNYKESYNGVLSINPFDLNLNIYLQDYKISKLLDTNPILIAFIKSGLLFNDNISLKTITTINSKEKKEIFQKAKINFNIINGEINLDNTIFINNDIGSLKLKSSNLFFENNNLILNTNILLEIKNLDNLFTLLNTNKKSRKKIRNIFINLNYDFLRNEIKFNKVKINDKDVNDQFLNIIDDFNDINSNNAVKSRRLLNKLLSIYDG